LKTAQIKQKSGWGRTKTNGRANPTVVFCSESLKRGEMIFHETTTAKRGRTNHGSQKKMRQMGRGGKTGRENNRDGRKYASTSEAIKNHN